MELREFVKNTLIEIAEGVKDAKEEYEKLGGEANPLSGTLTGQKTNNRITEVFFDVALTQTDTTDSSKGIGVMFSSIKVGIGNTAEQATSSLSRISFTVKVKLP